MMTDHKWRNDMTKTLKLSGKMKTIDLAKAMREHLDMLPGMIDKCHKHFIPMVAKMIGWPESPERFQIEFIEAMTQVSGLRFELQIDVEGITLAELQMITDGLAPLCSWEPGTEEYEPGFSLNGYTFTMGDGDDTGAVYMRNGKLCVWVRAWKE